MLCTHYFEDIYEPLSYATAEKNYLSTKYE